MIRIVLINGPSLNLLGTRQTDIYGHESFETFLPKLRAEFPEAEITYQQSNVEGELISMIHACRGVADGLVINAAGYTHTSIALGDAIAAVGLPAVEVHISNVYAREDFRKTSFIASRCIGSITGLGLDGYALAVRFLMGYVQRSVKR